MGRAVWRVTVSSEQFCSLWKPTVAQLSCATRMNKKICFAAAVFLVSLGAATEESGPYSGNLDVYSENDSLKAVVVGGDAIFYPNIEKAVWMTEGIKVLPKPEQEQFIQNSGKTGEQAGTTAKFAAENDELVQLLNSFGVQVWRPPAQWTPESYSSNYGRENLERTGFQTIFARDPFFTLGESVYELQQGSPFRRGEGIGYLDIYKDVTPPLLSMPSMNFSEVLDAGPGEFSKMSYPVLEGGDIMVVDKTVLVGNSLNPTAGSSSLGVEWLRDTLKTTPNNEFDVQEFALDASILHLDCALSFPKPGVVIACIECLIDGLPEMLKDYKVIEVSLYDAQHLAVNGLPIDHQNYILPTNKNAINGTWPNIQAGLEAEGVTVHPIEFAAHAAHGGAVRCATQPLSRQI